ncbi:MAG: hypothetical protein ACRES9_07900 [Gammaproteobacteria bacterium]
MRKLLIIGGVILAFFVAAHYARWQWANPGSHSHHNSTTIQNGHKHCGTVANVYHDTHDKGQPTFVDLGHDYPNQTFTIVIWQRDLSRFNPPPESWQGEKICVTGYAKMYKGAPEIIAYGPNQTHTLQ